MQALTRFFLKLPRIGFVALAWIGLGMVLCGALIGTVRLTDRDEFCLSCHEMAGAPYQEYLQSSHYRNRLGIRAGCADCHLPHDSWLAFAKAKLVASKDVYHHIIGTIATPEQFESRRAEMAGRVWSDLKSTDSEPCRSCHEWDGISGHRQESGSTYHQRAHDAGKTCVDCHRGLVHRVPK
jgi:nitrate/TMAO reductase-like tetraheme cytochrome c subunit